MNNFKIKRSIISIYFVILAIIIYSISTLLFDSIINDNSVEAASEWIQTSETDFNNGTVDNVVITPTDEIRLASEMKYIEDNFIDESKSLPEK